MGKSEDGGCTKEMLSSVMEELRRKTEKTVIRIELTEKKPGLTDSKFGGIPYLPAEAGAPTDSMGRQLCLLAQIRLDALPENDMLPKEGLLQFWALNDDATGLDFDDLTSQKESRVTYCREIDGSVREEDVKEKYRPFGGEESYFPVPDPFGLSFRAEKEGISAEDYRFDALFTECWNQKYPETRIEQYYDLPQELVDVIFKENTGFGHKLGGYPAFTQEDPRKSGGRYEEYGILLLQIDSVGLGDRDIMWGDSGVCNFFITEAALLKADFSRVMYTWDCY